jgi:ABC-type multidrug transport system ATPase subunit
MLDPLARQDFMATVLTAMTGQGDGEVGGVSVLLSSHALAELERVADYLILLSGGRLQVADEVDDLPHSVSLEELVVAYLRAPGDASVPSLALAQPIEPR